jgi:predicted metal-binding membrane protein
VIYDPREAAHIRNNVLLVAIAAWGLLLVVPHGASADCMTVVGGALSFRESLHRVLAMNSPVSLICGWMLMLAAMMLPLLAPAIYHIYQRSFARRRTRSIVLFLTAYTIVWMLAGVLLLSIQALATSAVRQLWIPAAATFVIAIIWQSSPVKQHCLSRCHANKELAAFGTAADLTAFRFGISQGIWCACSCWAWMLFVMLVPRGHWVAMIAVAALLFSERLESPQRPSWRLRGVGKTLRICVTTLKAHRLLPGN